MNYCSQQDLTERFSATELAQAAPDGNGGIDAVKVAAAISDADGEIDGYLASGGYATPLSTVPAIIKGYACDIARYRLYDDEPTEIVIKRYELAIKFLTAVSKGQIRLTANGVDLSGQSDVVGEAEFEAGRQVFKGGGF